MADLYITGRFCGVDSITAVANGSQVMHMLTVIIVGLAMGSTVIIGHAVGAGNMRDAEAAIGNTVTLFMRSPSVLPPCWWRSAPAGRPDRCSGRGRSRHGAVSDHLLHWHPVHHGIQHHQLRLPRLGDSKSPMYLSPLPAPPILRWIFFSSVPWPLARWVLRWALPFRRP